MTPKNYGKAIWGSKETADPKFLSETGGEVDMPQKYPLKNKVKRRGDLVGEG